MWLALALLAARTAVAGIPFELPPGESPATWEPALEYGGFTAGDASSGPFARIEPEGQVWRLVVCDCRGETRSVRLLPPASASEREALVVVARSLVHPVHLSDRALALSRGDELPPPPPTLTSSRTPKEPIPPPLPEPDPEPSASTTPATASAEAPTPEPAPPAEPVPPAEPASPDGASTPAVATASPDPTPSPEPGPSDSSPFTDPSPARQPSSDRVRTVRWNPPEDYAYRDPLPAADPAPRSSRAGSSPTSASLPEESAPPPEKAPETYVPWLAAAGGWGMRSGTASNLSIDLAAGFETPSRWTVALGGGFSHGRLPLAGDGYSLTDQALHLEAGHHWGQRLSPITAFRLGVVWRTYERDQVGVETLSIPVATARLGLPLSLGASLTLVPALSLSRELREVELRWEDRETLVLNPWTLTTRLGLQVEEHYP